MHNHKKEKNGKYYQTVRRKRVGEHERPFNVFLSSREHYPTNALYSLELKKFQKK